MNNKINNGQLLASGSMVNEIIEAAKLLKDDWDIEASIWSVTSYSELHKESEDVRRWNILHPNSNPRKSFLEKMIREETFKRFKETENKFYLYLWEYLNLLQSFTYVRPGLEPLRIKYPHTKLIDDPDNLNQPVLQITLFNTKNKPKISGTTSPYFNSIYFDILHREQPTIEDYLLFPREKNRENTEKKREREL